jgi:hypothetical protein
MATKPRIPIVQLPLSNTRTFDPAFNVEWETFRCLEDLYEILIELYDIKRALKKGTTITHILHPPFDPLKTIGKY